MWKSWFIHYVDSIVYKFEVCCFFISVKFTPERLSVENFKNNSVLFLSALQDLTLKCGKQIDGTVSWFYRLSKHLLHVSLDV